MNKLISSTFHRRPSTRRLAFSCPTNGSERGKTERGSIYVSPCVLCYSKSRNNKVQACPYAPPLPVRWEGHNARVHFYWLQFGNNSNAVADNRELLRGSSVKKQNNPLESRLKWSQSRLLGINLLLVRTCLLPWHSHSKLARLVVGPFWAWIWTGGGPSVQLMRLCSGRLHAAMWSCSSCWEKFWCICAASWASIVFPRALFKSLSSAEDQS